MCRGVWPPHARAKIQHLFRRQAMSGRQFRQPAGITPSVFNIYMLKLFRILVSTTRFTPPPPLNYRAVPSPSSNHAAAEALPAGKGRSCGPGPIRRRNGKSGHWKPLRRGPGNILAGGLGLTAPKSGRRPNGRRRFTRRGRAIDPKGRTGNPSPAVPESFSHGPGPPSCKSLFLDVRA